MGVWETPEFFSHISIPSYSHTFILSLPKVRVHLYIHGRVQGVGYRASALYKARDLNLTGWVKNLRDGRVEAVAEGEEETIAQFIQWCQKGPPGSIVKKVDVQREQYTGEFKQFDVAF